MLNINKGIVPINSWCNSPESSAIDQAVNLANHPYVADRVVLLPDCHAGMGMPIGCVVGLKNAISPNMVGSDISCGMMAVRTNLNKQQLDKELLLKIVAQIKRDVPMGFNKQSTDKYKKEAEKLLNKYYNDCSYKGIEPNSNMELSNVYIQLGTLGGGNHFCEIQYDENDNVWIMIHSGSRNIGKRINDEYDALAKKHCETIKLPSNELACFPDDCYDGVDYITNMNFCVEFSFINRECMLKDIRYAFERNVSGKVEFVEQINISHNYANLEEHFGQMVWVHRKGATSAKKDELGIIPGSQGSSSYIVRGLGNTESFMSCSHGAGRRMSRGQAKKNLTMEDFKKSMDGIVSLDIDQAHLDESAMAYKDIDVCMQEQEDLVDIVHILKPLANCKG